MEVARRDGIFFRVIEELLRIAEVLLAFRVQKVQPSTQHRVCGELSELGQRLAHLFLKAPAFPSWAGSRTDKYRKSASS